MARPYRMCSVLPRRKVIMRICLPMVMSCLWNGKMDFDLAGKRFNYSIKGTLADYYSVIDKFNNANMSLSEYANQSLDKNYYEGMRIGEIWGFVSMACAGSSWHRCG